MQRARAGRRAAALHHGASVGDGLSRRRGMSLGLDRRSGQFSGIDVDVDTITLAGEFRF